LRQRFIKEGRMNPDGQMRLEDSVKLYGICNDMCPEYERVRRIVEDDVKPPECTPETEHLPRKQRIPDETRMVKAYARSAAGMDVELVSEIRSPATCLKTFDYLMERLDNDEFDFLHSWIWDRTRAIRKDLRTQRIEQRSDITLFLTCLERSARFLILSAHQMARTTKEDYSHQQDIEQLNQTLMSLKERYADNRRVNYPSENEAEFWTYRLILAPLFTSSQFENELHLVPSDLRNNPRVKVGIEIYRAMKSIIFTRSASFVQCQANWRHFWDLIKSPSVSYLMACAAEVSFQRVRHVVLDALWRVYRVGSTSRPQTVESWTVAKVRDALGLDKDEEAIELCEAYGFTFKSSISGASFLDVTAKGFARVPLALASDISPQIFSQGIVEDKRCKRTFSAIVKAMSVQQARHHGLMVDSTDEDETSLFVPEGPASKPNVFKQARSGLNDASTLNPATNPFLPKTATSSGTNGVPNPFIPSNNPTAQVAASNVFSPSINPTAQATAPNPFNSPINPTAQVAASNPFLPKTSSPSATSFPGIAQPGLFDASRNAIKFGPPETASTPSTDSAKPNPFLPTAQSTPQTPSSTTTNVASTPGFNFFTQNAVTTAQQPVSTSSTTNLPTFSFSGISKSGDQGQVVNPAMSFTPAGSPASIAPVPQAAEEQKPVDEARRLQAEAEAEAQRQEHARQEQERQTAEAERQRMEAEMRQRRLQEEEQKRKVQEMEEQRRREDEERASRLQARVRLYDALAYYVLLNEEEGLIAQYADIVIEKTAAQVAAAEEEIRLKKLWKKRQATADAMYEQRIKVLKRAVLAKWIDTIEKKKRNLKARERRKRLKELRASRAAGQNSVEDASTSAEPETAADSSLQSAFQKPQMPASAQRTNQTDGRHEVPSAPANAAPDRNSRTSNKLEQQTASAILTPISMSSSHNAGYSEAYYKSTAPIDRTEGDYFKLRAEGLDPHKLRKRSFGSPSDQERPKAEPKRPKMTLSTTTQSSAPAVSAPTDRPSRLNAIGQSFGGSVSSSHAANQATSMNRRSVSNTGLSLVEHAKQVLNRTRSTRAQNHYRQSVPGSRPRAVSPQQAAFGKSVGTAASGARAAFWDRPSRFVPRAVYGKGPAAVRAYRQQCGLSSPANSNGPSAVSSPIPVQQSYIPAPGYTQEKYSNDEESSGLEIVDAEAEDEDAVTSEEEYEGDEESEEEDLDRRQSQLAQDYDEDDISLMQDGDELQYSNGYAQGQYAAEVLEDYDGYSDEDEDEEDDDDDNQYAQRAQFIQPSHGKQPQMMAGSTEDDAIELSD
jgi:hypothetical protein